MHTNRIFLGIGPKVNLSKNLIRERIAHNKARMAHGTTKVNQTSFGKQDNVTAIWQLVPINLETSE